MMKGREEEKAVVWFGKVFLSCCVTVVACDTNIKLGFIQFMESIPHLNEVDTVMCCIWPRWSISDKMYNTAKSGLTNLATGTLDVVEWYGMESLKYIAGCAHIVQAYPVVRPFKLTQPVHFTGSTSTAFTTIVLIIMRLWRQAAPMRKQINDYEGAGCFF